MVEVTPNPNGFGARIAGVDLTQPVSDGAFAAIALALHEHAAVVIPEQALTSAQFTAFGRRFGEPVLHVEEDIRLKEEPLILTLSNADGRPERQYNGGAFWHTDLVFTDEPASATMLNAVAVPRTGGETRVADQFAAYDALPETLRATLDPLIVRHCYEGRTDGSMPTVRHPLIRRHPVTGRRALYGVGGTALGIDGMPDDEARSLLDELYAHATDDRFVYEHHYAVHDLLIWDNACTLHCGPKLKPAEDDGDRRIMHRISVRGWPMAA